VNIFDKLQQGDSTSWHDDAATIGDITYTSAAYGLRYELRGPGAPLTLNAVVDNNGWKTSITTTQSEALTAGLWWFAAYYTATGVRVLAGEGEITITPDITLAGANFNNLSPAEVALKAAESALSTFSATGGKTKKYQIGGRSMEFATIPEIMQIIGYWKAIVLNEQSAKQMANGNGNPRRLYVRFR
jgi:hypothetical protein